MQFSELLGPDDLNLTWSHPASTRRLSFVKAELPYSTWAEQARRRAMALIGVQPPTFEAVGEIVRTVSDGRVRTAVIRLQVDEGLSLPGYLSWPEGQAPARRMVLALHGHGEVEACLDVDGVTEDYHHRFSHRLSQRGRTVFTPELRGFGALFDLAAQAPGAQLRYWRWGQPMAYTLQSDAFVHGRTLLGDTISDLQAWEAWLVSRYDIDGIDVAGISWGGDLACAYPLYSPRVRSIFASGTLGSFTATFRVSGNAPAHCIPGILPWLDRADIAGLNAPVPIAIHYGAQDTPGPGNESAAYNETAIPAFSELERIYAAAGAPAPQMLISADLGHEMDIDVLAAWIQDQQSDPNAEATPR